MWKHLQHAQPYITPKHLLLYTDKQFKRCAAVLQFPTGQQSVGGFQKKIEVGYIDDPVVHYPSAGTCALKLFLPTGQETFEEFSKDMDKALECEAFGFYCF